MAMFEFKNACLNIRNSRDGMIYEGCDKNTLKLCIIQLILPAPTPIQADNQAYCTPRPSRNPDYNYPPPFPQSRLIVPSPLTANQAKRTFPSFL